MKQVSSRRPLYIFYALMAYILAFSIWWAYLLITKTDLTYESRRQLLEMQLDAITDQGEVEAVQDELAALEVMQKKYLWMILGEGSVYTVLLLIGMWMFHRTFSKERALGRQQKNFLLSVSHELKSPLAAIRIALQTVGKPGLASDKQERLMENAIGDVDRINNLVDNILMASRMENNAYVFHHEPFNLSLLINDLIDKQRHLIPGVNIEAEIDERVMLKGDQASIDSLIANLLENAAKYSKREALISVSLKTVGKKALLSVADRGIGIPEEEKAYIFHKFYRVGQEETRKSKGTGLGLYIVKEVLRSHHGAITVENNHPEGTVFKVSLPLTA